MEDAQLPAGERPGDYRFMTPPERSLAVVMAKRIHKVQGRPEGLVNGAYMIIAGLWIIFFSISSLVYVFVGAQFHLVSVVFGPITLLAGGMMSLRLAQHRHTLRILRASRRRT